MKPENRTLNFAYKNHSFKIDFPNNRKYIQLQIERSRLSSVLDPSIDSEAGYASVLVDAIAFLSTLCPELITTLNINILELDFEEGVELSQLYNKELKPWFDGWMNYFFRDKTEVKEEVKTLDPSE